MDSRLIQEIQEVLGFGRLRKRPVDEGGTTGLALGHLL